MLLKTVATGEMNEQCSKNPTIKYCHDDVHVCVDRVRKWR